MGLGVCAGLIAVSIAEMADGPIVGRIAGVIAEMGNGLTERIVVDGRFVGVIDVPTAHIPTAVEQIDMTTSQDAAE